MSKRRRRKRVQRRPIAEPVIQRIPRAAIAMTKIAVCADDAATSWVQISEAGEWEGHDAGPFSLSLAEFESAIAAFKRQENPIVVDYEHSSTESAPEGAPAAGWIRDLETRAGTDGLELWAMVDWTERAAERIRASEYRFLSPVWLFDAPDRESGEALLAELHSLALTNTPFLDGMAPVELSRLRGAKETAIMKSVELQEAPEAPPEEAPEDEEEAALGPAGELLASALELEDPAELMPLLEANLEAVVSLLSGEEAEAEEPPAEEAAAKTAALSVAVGRNSELESRIAVMQSEIEHFKTTEAEAEADAAIACGRAGEDQRESLVKLYRTDRDLFASLVKSRPAMMPPGRVIKGAELNRNSAVMNEDSNAQVMELRRALGWSEERSKKALSRVTGGENKEI